MAIPYSLDLRKRCLAALARGESEESVALWAGVTSRTLRNWKKRYKETGDVLAYQGYFRGVKSRLNPDELRAHIERYPDMRLEDRGAILGCSRATMHRWIKRMGYSFKKRRFFTAKEKKNSDNVLMKN
jgi:transposase